MSRYSPPAEKSSGADRPAWLPLLDAAGVVGLIGALGVVFALDRGAPPAPPADPVPPPVVEVASAAVPDLPPLPFPEDVLPVTAIEPPPPPPPLPAVEEAPSAAPPPLRAEDLQPKPIDPKKCAYVGFTGTRHFGLSADVGKDEKRLTFSELGATNHTLVVVDGKTTPFLTLGQILKDLVAEGTTMTTLTPKPGGQGVPGGVEKAEVGLLPEKGPYVVRWGFGAVLFEQWVDFEANPVTRKIDTLRVRYTLSNEDRFKNHTAGIRLMLDTFIGSNDGVPFFIPGRQGVIDRPLTLTGDEVPETIMALERSDLTDKSMTVVQMRFGADNEERPAKLVLSQWPGNRPLAERFPEEQWRSVDGLPWDWRVAPAFAGDSAVGIYYPPKPLKPGEKRSFSFTYGLGSLSQGEGKSGLKLYSPGPFEAGKSFRLTAFVRNPKAGQSVTVAVPQGLTLAQGEAREKPVEVQAGVEVTKVDWLVSADPGSGGKFDLAAELSGTGITERLPVYVANKNPALRDLVVTGTPVSGGRFRLTAQVVNPTDGLKATLTLPPGLSLDNAQKADVTVPAGAVGQASWVVDAAADRSGDFKVEVKLSAGGAEASRTVTVRGREPVVHKVVVTGMPSAGGAFRVSAQVLFPKPGSAARIELPPGLSLAAGEKAEKPLDGGTSAQPSWVVRADRGASGKMAVKVQLQPDGPAASEALSVTPAVRALTVRLAKDEPAVRGRPFWVVADVSNPKPGDAAEIKLPTGFKLAPGHKVSKALEVKSGYGRAAWPVVMDDDVRGAVELSVTAVGVGTRTVKVTCQEGTLIQR